MRDANTRGGIFGSQEMFGGGLFDQTQIGFGQYEQAAAGLGEYFDDGEPMVKSFEDGVFGYGMRERQGMLQAWDDGSLGLVEQAEAGLGGGWAEEAGEKWLGGMGRTGLGWTTHDCDSPPDGINADSTSFWHCHDTQFAAAQQNCYALQATPDGFDKRGFSDFDDCVRKTRDVLIDANCLKYCAQTAANYRGGDPCNSGRAIMYAQKKLGVAVDGNWGSKSQAALVKSGTTFQGLIGCVGGCPAAVKEPGCSGQCMQGFEVDLDTGLCVQKGPRCPPGQVLTSSGGCAKPSVPIVCDIGQQMVNGKCVAIGCPAGQQMINGKCAPIAPPGKSKMTMWLVGGGLVAAGIVTAIYFGTRKKAA